MDKRFCSACGQEVAEGAAFCSKCGARVGEPMSTPTGGGHPRVYSVPSSDVREPVPLAAPSGYSSRSGTAPPKAKDSTAGTLGKGCLVIVGLLIALGIVGNLARSPASVPAPTAAAQAATNGEPIVAPGKPAAAATSVPAKPTVTVGPMVTPMARIGQAVTGKNWEYTVTKVERPDPLRWAEYGSETSEKAIGKWLIVYLGLKNIGRENFAINTWDFEVHDKTGITYKTTDKGAAYSYPRALKLQALGERIPPGVGFTSVLLFDTAPDAAGLRLWLGQEKQYVDLGV